MTFKLDELVDEMLSFERKEEIKKTNIFQRIHDFSKRQEVEKKIQDEIQFENDKVIKLGNEAKTFLSSNYYKDLIEPYVRQTIKGGIQNILRDGDKMTEIQIKSEIACINKALRLIASLKLKIMQAEEIKHGAR